MRAMLLAAAIALAGAGFAVAAGEDSGGTNPASNCKKGAVWDGKKKACVKASSGVLPDVDLYEQGRMLAKAGHYDWALQVLGAIENQSDPRVLNYIGYSHRKLGEIATGIGYYREALAIDPDFVLAREYLGEGYVATGRVDLARTELGEIEQRCGTACEEYRELAEHIHEAVN